MEKTNAIRILAQKGIDFDTIEYDANQTDGQKVADLVGKTHDEVFKTLVAQAGQELFVFVIPVNCTLNLKKAAKAVGQKSLSMLKQKDLLPRTGYVHGGCSPVGQKKAYPTVIADTAQLFEKICVSAGRKGLQMVLNPNDLISVVGGVFADIVE